MSETAVSPRESVPSEDWRQVLVDKYRQQGFVPWMVIAMPPYRPVERKTWLTGGRYEFDQTELPYESPDDQQTASAYGKTINALRQDFGQDNVVIAFPTPDMIEVDPAYGERPHHLLMARGGGLLQPQFADKSLLPTYLAKQLPAGQQDGYGDGQVEAAVSLGNIGRGQVNSDAFTR